MERQAAGPILGIETSCDETAVAIVAPDGRILAQALLSQTAEHAPYGGVVPEIAARAHMQHLERLLAQAFGEANLTAQDLVAIAVTAGPGLIGGVIVGVMTAKALASVHRLPLYAINHLEGHALSPRLAEKVAFPYLLLLVSGGHCQLLIVRGVGQYEKIGATRDDALGEAFDKTAKMLGLGYPGGPAVEQLAKKGDATRFVFPRPFVGQSGCDFSFSGLKTAVRREIVARSEAGELDQQTKADIAASFQHTVAAILDDRVGNAIARFKENGGGDVLVVAGGVAANRMLHARLTRLAESHGLRLVAPPIPLCTDNAAMIAWAAQERRWLGVQPDNLDFLPRARWPLSA